MAGSAPPVPKEICLAQAGFRDLPKGWDIVQVEELLSDDRGISVGVVYPGNHDPLGIPLIKAGDMSGCMINPHPEFRITADKHYEYRRTEFSGGEILMTLVGEIGQCAIVPPEMGGWNAARAVAVIRLAHPADAYYVRLCLLSRPIRHLMDVWANTTVQPTLNLKEIRQLPLPWPPKLQRDRIARIGKALDDKIELNRRMNETLEAMARAIFKSWFVDFDPVRAKMDGRQPHGMDTDTAGLTVREWIDEGALIIGDGYRAKRVELGEPGLPFVRAGNLQNHGFSFENAEFLSEPSVKAAGEKVSQPNDIAFTSKGTVGRMTLVTTRTRPFVYSPQVCWWRVLDNDSIDPHVLYRWMESPAFMNQVSRVKGQTDMADYVSLRDQRRMRLTLPTIEHQRSISKPLECLDDKIAANLQESETLAALRDTLLPRLLSGELRVADAEGRVEESL